MFNIQIMEAACSFLQKVECVTSCVIMKYCGAEQTAWPTSHRDLSSSVVSKKIKHCIQI